MKHTVNSSVYFLNFYGFLFRSTESEADTEAFRRDLDGGDDFRLDEVTTLPRNNRVSPWQVFEHFTPKVFMV